MNSKALLSSLLFLIIGLLGFVSAAGSSANAGSKESDEAISGSSLGPDSFDQPINVDPLAVVDYVINFDETKVRKEDMDAAEEWLKAKGIHVKEDDREMASYAAYMVAPMNRQTGKPPFSC